MKVRSEGDGTKTEDYFSFPNLPGSLKGEKYKIMAVAWPHGEGNFLRIDSETYNFTVYKPRYTTKVHGDGGQQLRDVSGYVELSRHYFDGLNIIMEGYVSAYNGSNDEVNGSAWFRHTWSKDRFDPLKHAAPSVKLGPGQSYGPHYTDSMILNFPVGGPIGEVESYELNAHIHLETGVDHRHVDHTYTFSDEDNP